MSAARSLPGVLFWLILALFLCVPMLVSAQANQCDRNLQPISGNLGYVWRGDRCEGLYTSPVSAHNLEVVSLLKGKLRFELQRNTRLKVTAPNIANVAKGPIQVRVVGLPLKAYYRMDAVLPATGQMLWPVDDVLLPSQLPATMIGLFGWVGPDTKKTFVPLLVTPQGEPPPQGGVELLVRSPVEVEMLKWRASIVGRTPATLPPWQDVVTAPVPAGRPMAITLPDGAPAVLRLEVAAKEQNKGEWSMLEIRVIRPGFP